MAETFPTKVLRFFATRPSSQLAFIAIIIGFSFGFFAKEFAPSEDIIKVISYIGVIFINSLKVMVLIFIIIVMLKTPMDMLEISSAKKLGFITITFFICITLLSSLTGLAFVNIIRPGKQDIGQCKSQVSRGPGELKEVSLLETILDIGRLAIPPNIFKAVVEDNIMGILTIFLLLGFFLASYSKSENGKRLKGILDLLYQATLDILELIIAMTPLGVFSLISGEIAKIQDNCIFLKLFLYMVTYILALFFHVFVWLNLILFLFTRKNPFIHFAKFFKTIIIAFSTASSAASLPLNLKTAYQENIDQNIANFVLPLGTTLNMNGTGAYFSVTVVFITLLYDIPLNFASQLVCCFVGTLVAVGSAPIPSGALVYLTLVAATVGVNIPHSAISLIWAIDPIMDRLITCVNVMGDSYAAAIIEVIYKRSIGENDNKRATVIVKKENSKKSQKEAC